MKQIDCGLNIPDWDDFFETQLNDKGGFWEKEILDKALSYVKDWRLAIDGGAHIGTWTRPLAEKFDTVFGFEPDPENFECLRENTKALPNVVIKQMGLGDKAETKILSSNLTNSGMNYILPPHERQEGFTFATEMLSIDSLNLDHLGLLKLDLEGYEFFALQGAIETIKRCHPVICMELWWFKRYGIQLEQIKTFLDELGYLPAAYFQSTQEGIFVYNGD